MKAIMRWTETKLTCNAGDREGFTNMSVHFYIGVQAQPCVLRALSTMNDILMLLKTEKWSDPCTDNHINELCLHDPKTSCDEVIQAALTAESMRIEEMKTVSDPKLRQHPQHFIVEHEEDQDIKVYIRVDSQLRARRTTAAEAAGAGESGKPEWLTKSFKTAGRAGWLRCIVTRRAARLCAHHIVDVLTSLAYHRVSPRRACLYAPCYSYTCYI